MEKFHIILLAIILSLAGCALGTKPEQKQIDSIRVVPLYSPDVLALSADNIVDVMRQAGFTDQQILDSGTELRNILATSGSAQVYIGERVEAILAVRGHSLHISSRQRGSFIFTLEEDTETAKASKIENKSAIPDNSQDDDKDAEIEKLRREVESKKKQLKELQEQLKSLESTYEADLKKAKTAQEKISQLEQEAEMSASKLASAQNEIEKIKASHANRIAELSQEIEILTQNIAQKDRQIADLSDDPVEKLHKERIQRLKPLYNSLIDQLAEEIDREEVQIKWKDGSICAIINGKILFDPGEFYPKNRGSEVIRKIGRILKDEMAPDMQITIGGHADPTSIEYQTHQFHSGWEISSIRACTIARIFGYSIGIESKNLSTAGYSYFRPIADNETEADRSRNRRIEIVISVP